MPKRLIALMELKEKHLGEFFFSGAARKDLLSWDQNDTDDVVGKIRYNVGMLSEGEALDVRLCPHCIERKYATDKFTCDDCFWRRAHGKCNSKGSLYHNIRYTRGANEDDIFRDIDLSEVLRCLRT